MRERQEKQNLERRLENLMMVMEGLVVDLPGAASGDTRTASSHFAKPVKPSEHMMVTVKMGTHSSTHASCTWGYV